ncbi:MAG: hypothetical protein COA77_07755 [Thaumarchaeota archaeon]|nr:MAG: hypothetical protein COA77_07755 [Nitrososphaerota archaeon]
MKFCHECGEDLKGSTKFCPEYGFNIGTLVTQEIKKEVLVESNVSEESVFDDEILEEPLVEKTTRELGTNLEDMAEKILQDRGFSTETRTKIRGISGQLNEIDIMAKRNRITLAVECKNYAETNKVGIKEIRDFSAKLDDLDIKRGLFITSSDFSQDAIGWATNNPQLKQIDLWNGNKLTENFQATVLGRSGGQLTKVSDCLNPRDTIENYSEILLKNKDNVGIARRDLIFHPYYIIQFTLREQFKTPDKQIHSQFNSGQYVVDGLTREILYCSDDNGEVFYEKKSEQKQVIEDLMNIEPYKIVEIQKIDNSNVIVHKASMSIRDVEFTVKKTIIEDNKAIIPYWVKKSRDEEDEKEFTHVPNHKSIQVQSKTIHVPKLEIIFDSKEYTYARRLLPASDITLVDEISECKHLLKKKHTFAVCETCGIAKCEDDIFVDEQDLCYCKNHASQELKESKKGKSIKDKLGFSFRKNK